MLSICRLSSVRFGSSISRVPFRVVGGGSHKASFSPTREEQVTKTSSKKGELDWCVQNSGETGERSV